MQTSIRPHPNSRPVICLDTGEIFPSVKRAARKLGIGDWSLHEILKGKEVRVDFKWRVAYVSTPSIESADVSNNEGKIDT